MFFVALTIARTTFLESVRQPIYFIIILLSGLAQVLNTAISGYSLGYSDSSEVFGDNKMLLDVGLATVLFSGTLLAGFIATAAVSREIENKTVLTVVSKPVSRIALILGKYLGGAAAMVVAVVIMLLFLQVALRHGVLSTVRDELDGPVLFFSIGAVALACAVAIWGNFFYGWHFSQTASLLTLPLMILAWLLVMIVSKKWAFQSPLKDFKPQIAAASVLLTCGMLVLTAVAVAASTRLSQVMTIVAVYATFVVGLLSNHLVGRHAFSNELLAEVTIAEPERDRFQSFATTGDIYTLTLKAPPGRLVKVGDPLYYGPNPNGFDLVTPNFTPFKGDLNNSDEFFKLQTPPAIVITSVKPQQLVIRHLGGTALPLWREPKTGDFLFTAPTRVNPFALAAWGVIPNMQYYWLTDAITQNRPAPLSHLFKVILYTAVQVSAFLALAVVLFQKREVG